MRYVQLVGSLLVTFVMPLGVMAQVGDGQQPGAAAVPAAPAGAQEQVAPSAEEQEADANANQPAPAAAPPTHPNAEAPTTTTPTPAPSQPAVTVVPETPPRHGAAGWSSSEFPPEYGDDGAEEGTESLMLHGFRIGYAYMFGDQTVEGGASDHERFGLESPHSFLIGYEIFYRLIGHSWLNVLLVGNVIVAGLDQSKFLPSANLLLGFEFDESFQVGLGMNLAPDTEKPTHMIVAAGWTPRVGNFYVPLHFFFIPDVDGYHRLGATTGVTL